MLAGFRGRSPTVTVSQAYHSSDPDPTMGVASRNQLALCQCSSCATSANPAEISATDSPNTRILSFQRQSLGCHSLRRPTGWVNLVQRRRKNWPNGATSGASEMPEPSPMVAYVLHAFLLDTTAFIHEKDPRRAGDFGASGPAGVLVIQPRCFGGSADRVGASA